MKDRESHRTAGWGEHTPTLSLAANNEISNRFGDSCLKSCDSARSRGGGSRCGKGPGRFFLDLVLTIASLYSG